MINADKGARVGNYIVDMIMLCIIIMVLSYIVYLFYPAINNDHSLAFDILFSITYFSYYFFSEFFFGKTIGKIFTKTIVKDRNGNKPKVIFLIIRTLIRMFPIEVFTFLFGNYGLHDLLSRTTVVKMEAATKVKT